METEAPPKTSEELIPESERLQEISYETEKHLENEKRRKTFWKVLATVIICIWLYEKSPTVSGCRSLIPNKCVLPCQIGGVLKCRHIIPSGENPPGNPKSIQNSGVSSILITVGGSFMTVMANHPLTHTHK